jgi:hypothetical protein
LYGILDKSEKDLREKEKRDKVARQTQHSKLGFFERVFRSASVTAANQRPGFDPEGDSLKSRIRKAKENMAQHKVLDFPDESAKRANYIMN